MYAIKVIRHENSDGVQQTFLFSSNEVIYENIVFKDEKDFHSKIRKLSNNNSFSFLGDDMDISSNSKGGEAIGMSLLDNSNTIQYLIIMKAWIFIMLNGKTIDKLVI